jgi:ASCH domain
MKCLTIRQPWAWLIVARFKSVENRTWPTKLRGEVLIHASKDCTASDFFNAWSYLTHGANATRTTRSHAKQVPQLAVIERGAVIGKATLVDCVTDHPSPYFVGPYGHVFTNAQRCEPFQYKGALNYFDVPDDLVSQLKWIDQA